MKYSDVLAYTHYDDWIKVINIINIYTLQTLVTIVGENAKSPHLFLNSESIFIMITVSSNTP